MKENSEMQSEKQKRNRGYVKVLFSNIQRGCFEAQYFFRHSLQVLSLFRAKNGKS